MTFLAGLFGGGPSAPTPPDYAALVQQEAAANQQAAISQFQLNNANQISPWGSRQLTDASGNPVTGPTGYNVTTTLNPQEQANLTASQAAQGQLLGLAPNVINNASTALQTPINTGNLPPMAYGVDTGGSTRLNLGGLPGAQYSVGSPDDIRNQVMNANWNQYITRASPLMQVQQDQLNTRLANMGGVTTDAAAMRAQNALRMSQGDQINQAIQNAIMQGGNAAQQQQQMNLSSANLWNQARQQDANLAQTQAGFNNQANQQDIQNAFANANLTNASRAQGINEQAQLQQLPLNEMMALLSGTQVNSPQFGQTTPSQIQPANILGTSALQQQTAQQQYQNQLGSYNNMLGSLGTLGADALMAPAGTFSNLAGLFGGLGGLFGGGAAAGGAAAGGIGAGAGDLVDALATLA